MEVKEVEVLTNVTPPGPGSPKFMVAKSPASQLDVSCGPVSEDELERVGLRQGAVL